MKKSGILNSQLSRVVSQMGHTDGICIGDAGLPVPCGTERIDLAVLPGVPSFLQVVDSLLQELQVEKVVLAQEIKTNNPDIHQEIIRRLPNADVVYVSHEEFKSLTKDCKAVIRTGEFSPYANVVLKSGVVF